MKPVNFKYVVASLIGKDDKNSIHIDPIHGGGNNRSYLITTNDDRYFLKHYFNDISYRNRLQVEYSFSSYAWQSGIRCIARPIAYDTNNFIGIYEYVNGRKLSNNEIKEDEVIQSLNFLTDLNSKKSSYLAKKLSVASDAGFSIFEHICLVGKRIEKLKKIIINDDIDSEANLFINKLLIPAWNELENTIKANTKGILHNKIEPNDIILSPSDFGFHNALLTDNKQIKFIDFEYSGWDDPAKLICDYFSQPAVPVPIKYFWKFANTVSNLSMNPMQTMERVKIILPLVRLKWCCIVLNCFIPDLKIKKMFINDITDEYKISQISKAKKIFNSIYELEKGQ
ncbi:MAG: aminoglycoside phosphotransferase family protein [uncultured bacterium]|nr:MAG: aminoglycoside phosphotransferase family protein [uncultured bacterium]